MRLKTQILLGFLFILLLTVILAGVFTYYIDALGKASNRVLKDNYGSIKASEDMIVNLAKIDQIITRISIGKNYNEQILLNIIDNEKALFEKSLVVAQQNISEVGESNVVENLQEEYAVYNSYLEIYKESEQKVDLYFTVMQRQNEVLRELCISIIEINQAALGKKDTVVQKLYFNAKIYVFILTVLVLIIASIAIIKIPQKIVQPIIDITNKIKRISEGNYDQKIDVNSESELGELSKAFNQMTAKLKEFEESNFYEIKAQKSRIEQIIKGMNDGLLVLDEHKTIILSNETAANILKIEEEQLPGRKAIDVALKNNVMRDLMLEVKRMEDQDSEYREGRRSNFIKISGENDTQEFYTKEIVKVYSHDNDERKFLGYIIMMKDVTHFKKTDEAKTNFISVVSHELKTPLSAMNMSLMLLQDERLGKLSDEQNKLASSMKIEVQRLIKMVSELLDLSRVETGRMQLDKKPIDPKYLLEYSLTPIESQLKEKSLSIAKQVEELLPEINVDSDKISWVLNNFLTNAIRFSPQASQIQISVLRDGDYVEFSVKDEGPGIAPENQDKVFNRFVQLSNNGAKNKNGLGLGLTISKEVIEEHHGKIGVQSKVGEGSKFYFRVPIE